MKWVNSILKHSCRQVSQCYELGFNVKAVASIFQGLNHSFCFYSSPDFNVALLFCKILIVSNIFKSKLSFLVYNSAWMILGYTSSFSMSQEISHETLFTIN